LDELASLLGYEGPHGERTLKGSIWRRALANLRGNTSSDEIQQRLLRVERALELESMDKQQAQVDSKTASAVSQLMSSLADVPQAVVRVGSILLIKYQSDTGTVFLVRSLSQTEIRAMDQFPELQTRPERLLDALALAVENIDSGRFDLSDAEESKDN
jgi:hypothetical protein